MKKETQTLLFAIAGALFVLGAILMLIYSFGGVDWLFPVGMTIAVIASIMLITVWVMHRKSLTKTEPKKEGE